jgi:hypothetical protein
MNTATIEDVSRLYETQRQPLVQPLRADHELFRQFSLRLQKFLQALHPIRDSEVVVPSLRILKRYRFDMCAAPINFAHPSIISADILHRLDGFAERYQSAYPRQHERFIDIVQALKSLVESDDNPLFREITTHLHSGSACAILLKESRHIKVFEQILITNRLEEHLTVLSQHQLRRGNACYDKLFVVGAASWFPEFILRAPRAQKTYVINYSWLSGRINKPKPAFDGWEKLRSYYPGHSSNVSVLPSLELETSSVDEGALPEISPDDVVPQVNLSEVMKEASHSGDGQNDEQVFVAARLCRLEDGTGIFVEDREGARSLVIDLEEEDRSKVKRVVAGYLRPGMFVILRSDEDDEADYIVPLANGLLGTRANGLRKFQSRWKVALRGTVTQHGAAATIRTLVEKGSIRANEVNLANWMSERSIRTEDRRDFNAIMDLIGLLSDTDKCWAFSGEIDRAHRRAGRLVRKQLMKLVNEIDLMELERLGMMRFELVEIGARPLLAVRVAEVSHGSINISQSRLNRPFALPEVLD